MSDVTPDTGWRRPIGCLKLQVIFRQRATNYRALLQKMTYKDEVSYGSSPPCSVLQTIWSTNYMKCRIQDTIQRTRERGNKHTIEVHHQSFLKIAKWTSLSYKRHFNFISSHKHFAAHREYNVFHLTIDGVVHTISSVLWKTRFKASHFVFIVSCTNSHVTPDSVLYATYSYERHDVTYLTFPL